MTRYGLAFLLALSFTAVPILSAQQRYVKEAHSGHFLFLKDDGSVWGSGNCTEGQLSLVASELCQYVRSPTQIALPGRAIDVAAGGNTSFALLEDGTVYAWGADLEAQLGTGAPFVVGKNRANRPLPAPVSGLTGIVQISACETHAAALKSDGTVWLWGAGFSGGTRDIPAVGPVQVASIPPIQSISVSHAHILALARDGSVFAWGSNSHGQLGDGTTKSSPTPVRVAPLAPAVSVAAGRQFSVAVLVDGSVRVWGANSSATMGNGTRESEWTAPGSVNMAPAAVPGVIGAKSVAAGDGTVLVLLKDGTLRSWGHDGWGQTGIGSAGGYQPKPVTPKLSGVDHVFLSKSTAFAITRSGQLYVWGFGHYRLAGVMKANLRVPTLFTSE